MSPSVCVCVCLTYHGVHVDLLPLHRRFSGQHQFRRVEAVGVGAVQLFDIDSGKGGLVLWYVLQLFARMNGLVQG